MPDASMITSVGTLRLHPSTWGYYISDEPGPTERDLVAAFAARVKALDPTTSASSWDAACATAAREASRSSRGSTQRLAPTSTP